MDVQAQPIAERQRLSGTYSIAASGQGFLSNPLFPGPPAAILIYGMVNAQGIFVGSSTENQNGYNDVFIAAPLSNTAAHRLHL